MAIGNEVRERVFEIVKSKRSNPEDAAPDFEAMLAVYAFMMTFGARHSKAAWIR